MLREYTSKPKRLLMCPIKENGTVEDIGKNIFKYTQKGPGGIITKLDFKVTAKQAPEVGDYIAYASQDNVYLIKKVDAEAEWTTTCGIL